MIMMVSISSSFLKKSSPVSPKFFAYEWFSVFVVMGCLMVLVGVTLASRTDEMRLPSIKERRVLVKKIQVSKLKKVSKKRARSTKKKSRGEGVKVELFLS
ncbi:putative uncharacterized protein [Parachlamydia acanthamoebae UV-7]|uniref:Uncharacterized protein n=3 Tax=Parachlamydia acanthamoebae TaxID=83552 RepID=F8L1T8_PARAV|nr:hypothetical protein DB43_GV00560 [Parachlamydia acanthamoebae]CCB87252.1 putative uncharacterized protein [Parachlamydia acanthamoebae UV-7]